MKKRPRSDFEIIKKYLEEDCGYKIDGDSYVELQNAIYERLSSKTDKQIENIKLEYNVILNRISRKNPLSAMGSDISFAAITISTSLSMVSLLGSNIPNLPKELISFFEGDLGVMIIAVNIMCLILNFLLIRRTSSQSGLDDLYIYCKFVRGCLNDFEKLHQTSYSKQNYKITKVTLKKRRYHRRPKYC